MEILTIIEELGKLINNYKNELIYKDIQISNLKSEIERLENKYSGVER